MSRPCASLRATTTSPLASTPMGLERVLRQIEPDAPDSGEIRDRFAHGRLRFGWVDDNDHLGALTRFGAPSTPSP
jgi:hypothetical protein